MRKYVHRVGRTARAGRLGDAWTLVEEQEVRPVHFSQILHTRLSIPDYQARYFKTMLRDAGHLDKVKRVRVGEKEVAPLVPHYEVRLFSPPPVDSQLILY